MKCRARLIIICCAAMTVLAFTPSRADADPKGTGYVCKIISYKASSMPAFGEHGVVTVNFTSQPDCKGSYLWHGFFFSRGAKSRWAHTDHLLSKDDLEGTVELLRWAAAAKRRVSWLSCPGKKFCISGYTMGTRMLVQERGWGQTIRKAIAHLLQKLSSVG